jgi:ligand-binding sensor domain-containing protein/signal transduction histidine kinase
MGSIFISRRTILFLMLAAAFPVLGQQPVLNKIPPPEGVYWVAIMGMGQDPQGFVWLATQNGLFRYDGYRYIPFYHDPDNANSPASNRTESLFVTKGGIVWIGFLSNGLDRFDPATGMFTHFIHDPNDSASLSDNGIRAILEDRQGVLWVGTNRGLHRFHPESGTFTRYRHNPQDPSSLSHDGVGELYEDRQGTLWVGTGGYWDPKPGEGGLNRFHPETGTFTRYLHDPKDPHSLSNNKVGAIFEDSRGTFWVGTLGDGLHTMDREKGTFTRHRHDPRQPDKLSRAPIIGDYKDGINFIHEDVTGAIWIGTFGSGVSRYNPSTEKVAHLVSNTPTASGLRENSVSTALSLKEGVLLIGTFSEGHLYRTDPLREGFAYQPTGARVFGFVEDAALKVWVATENGLQVYGQSEGNGSWLRQSMSLPASLAKESVRSILQDSKGTLWVGGRQGLWRQDLGKQAFTLYTHDPQEPASIGPGLIPALEEGRDGVLWVGTESGLNRMDPETGAFTKVKLAPDNSRTFSEHYIPAIKEDKFGNLWVGTLNAGIYRIDRTSGTIKPYLNRTGHSISAIREDEAGRLWAGTIELGLFWYDPGKDTFISFTDKSTGKPLFSNVMAMEMDGAGNLWVSSLGGLAKLNRERILIANYGEEAGLKPETFGYLAAHRGKKGTLYIGATNGFYAFMPQKARLNQNPPQIVLTDFRLFDEPVVPGEGGPLRLPVGQAGEIDLRHHQNAFSFEFAGIHFTNPGRNRHLYQLENYDTGWREAGEDPSAAYYQVPPGNYVFRVRAASSEGVWAERALPVVVHPPWWRTWWAYGIYGLLLAGAIFTVDRTQRRRIVHRERERARERELAQAREIEKAYNELKRTQVQLIQKEKMASLGELTAGIAHEIQNPLNFVNNFSEVSKELVGELREELEEGRNLEATSITHSLEQNLEKIHQHGRRAEAIVKNMLQHSRATSGEKQPTNLNALADEYLRLAYHGLRAKDKSFTCTLVTDLDPQLQSVEVVPQDMGRVLLNLYNNAFYAVQQKARLVPVGAEEGATGYQPSVKVSTRQEGDRVELRVWDNGVGVPEQVQAKIFQPFFTTKPTGEGTGLGLSLSYDIVTKGHGGELKVKSKEGEGTEFIVDLPILFL